MRNKAKFVVFWAVLGAASANVGSARAQVGTEGRISTRSDVRMSIEGAPGTGGKKLEALAKHLGTPLGDVKRCYAEVVKAHPEVVGSLGVACASVTSWVGGAASPTRLAEHGGGNAPFTDACPGGYMVTRLNAETGSLVDRIQGTCTRVRQ